MKEHRKHQPKLKIEERSCKIFFEEDKSLEYGISLREDFCFDHICIHKMVRSLRKCLSIIDKMI